MTGELASEMESSSDSVVRKFNPGVFQSDEELISQFVVRQPELHTVLEVLRDNINAPACQHLLVVAPRGRGKTMLLARVAAELRTNAVYCERLMPVRFMEESHEVSCIGDFWLEVLFYLANECACYAPGLAKELTAAHGDLSTAWRDRDYADRVRATVLMAADQLDRKLVLMVENLQDLCDDVDEDFGWQLRESLQMEPAVMLLATATSRFKALDDAREPFFELFMTIGLDPLDTDDCRRLWEVVSGESVERRDMRPLEILTGGNPRLLTIVAELGRHQSVRRLMEHLVVLVDDHTEYFRNHLEGLPKTERRVYIAAVSLWQPSSTSEIAARARMDIRLASSMLGRLVERGALVATGGNRKRRYAASERLYCLYYKIRRKRDEAGVVQMLIRFMTVFYSKTRGHDMSAKLIAQIRHDSVIRRSMIEALKGDSDVLSSAPEAVIAACDQEMRNGAIKPLEMANLMTKRQAALYYLERYQDAIEANQAIIDRFDTERSPQLQGAVANAQFRKGLAMQKMNNLEGAIAVYDEVVATYDADADRLNVVLAAKIVRATLHVRLGRRHQEALGLFDDIVNRYGHGARPFLAQHVAKALLNKGTLLARISETWRLALKTWQTLVTRFADSDDPTVRGAVATAYSKIAAVQVMHGLADEALLACDEAVAYAEDCGDAEARAHAYALLFRSCAQRRLGRIDDALESQDELNSRLGDTVDDNGLAWRWHATTEKVSTYYSAGLTDLGRETLRALYAMLDPKHEVALADLYRLAVHLAAIGVPSEVLADELAADLDKAQALWPLVVAFARSAGESVCAPEEVMAVADDILQEIGRLRVQLASSQQAGLAEERPAP